MAVVDRNDTEGCYAASIIEIWSNSLSWWVCLAREVGLQMRGR